MPVKPSSCDMHIQFSKFLAFAALIAVAAPLSAQQVSAPLGARQARSLGGGARSGTCCTETSDTEVWEPVPKVVTRQAHPTPRLPPTQSCYSTARTSTSGCRTGTNHRPMDHRRRGADVNSR